MQLQENIDYQAQIEEAVKRAKWKKVLYLYDENGHRQLLGIFSKKRASQVKKCMRSRRLIDRLIEFEIRTTEPDSSFEC